MGKKNSLKIAFMLSIGLLLLNNCSNSTRHTCTTTKVDIKKYVDLKEYVVRCGYYDDHQAYYEVIISNSDKRTLLQKYKFEDNLSKLQGRFEPAFVSENPNYVYYVNPNGQGMYGYILYALEKNGNTLIIYEVYGG